MVDSDKATSSGARQRIARLETIDDAAFLREAYLVVLGRGADRAGEAFYLDRLKAGANRREILQTLAESDEGSKHLARHADIAAALSEFIGTTKTPTNSVDGLIALSDVDFADASLRLLLGQGHDVATRIALVTRLRGGVPRRRILVELAAASNRPGFPDVEGLDALIVESRAPLFPVARSLDELFSLHDEAFVDGVYKTVLARTPDFQGMAHYVGRLREGHSRSSVLYELSMSSEGRARNVRLPGLSRLQRFHPLGKVPLLGWLLAGLTGVEADTPAARRRRLLSVLVMRNYALQAQMEASRGAGGGSALGTRGLETAMLARQEAWIDIQRDSFDREINALRKMVVRLLDQMDRPSAARASDRGNARGASRRPR